VGALTGGDDGATAHGDGKGGEVRWLSLLFVGWGGAAEAGLDAATVAVDRDERSLLASPAGGTPLSRTSYPSYLITWLFVVSYAIPQMNVLAFVFSKRRIEWIKVKTIK
jgi:hypothetical protein